MGLKSLAGRAVHARGLLLALAGAALLVPACEGDGHFTLLGYTTRPNYDTHYHTIRVPIFKSKTFWSAVPVPGLEMELTRAVIREIEDKTPYKVVGDDCQADTELIGTVVSFNKAILNYNQNMETRETETTLVVELYWRDIRTGEILSRPMRRPGQPLPADIAAPPGLTDPLLEAPGLDRAVPIVSAPGLPSDSAPAAAQAPVAVPAGPVCETSQLPGQPTPPGGLPRLPPVVTVRSVADFRPELGETLASAQKMNYDRMAVQIVSMLEKPW
jgi:hypothetical protein